MLIYLTLRHSGASRSDEPGIHNPDREYVFLGLRLAAYPRCAIAHRGMNRKGYLPPRHSVVRLAISAVAGSRIAEGVREKRGAGAGWVTPWRLTKVFRAAMCGCCGASAMVRTGAKHTSLPSMILHHSSRVFALKTSVSFCLSAGQALRSIWASKSVSESPASRRSSA